MKTVWAFLCATTLFLIVGCSPVKVPQKCQYQLNSYCATHWDGGGPCRFTLMVSIPEAAAAFQTTQMLYVDQPFELEAFAYHAWFSPPASMLYSLLIKSLQSSGFFYAVTSSVYGEAPDFRLDTHLLTLEQNFLKKPSEIEFSAKVVLTHVSDNRVIVSQIINKHIPCSSDNPLGGVIAANKAVELFTAEVNDLVISHTHNPRRHSKKNGV